MTQPLFETDRLLVRDFTVEDAPACFEIYRDPEVLRYLGGGEPLSSLESTRDLIERNLTRNLEQAPYGQWAVVVRDTERLIGTILLLPLEDGPEVEVGYHFGQFAWGRGYATEATRGALRYGFDVIGLKQICGVVFPENLASRRVLEKVGMTYRGMRLTFGFDLMYYTIDRADARPESLD